MARSRGMPAVNRVGRESYAPANTDASCVMSSLATCLPRGSIFGPIPPVSRDLGPYPARISTPLSIVIEAIVVCQEPRHQALLLGKRRGTREHQKFFVSRGRSIPSSYAR